MIMSNPCLNISAIISVFVLFSLFSPVFSSNDFREENESSMPAGDKLNDMEIINAHLRKINKPFLLSHLSPDGDIIDCVFFHLQPAFDIPELREKMSLVNLKYLILARIRVMLNVYIYIYLERRFYILLYICIL
ncbi:hypothetical protein HanPI659440_Chr12g0443391 [Helianthus annuus]|nr:hypothetical protein HanPI659440_Chr12g0443391 [Helianthus annuus]